MRREGWCEANELVVCLRESKADQFNEGCVLTHHLAADSEADLCVVRALRDLFAVFPERAPGGAEEDMPLFRWEDGSDFSRCQMRKLLADAGEEFGIPADATGTHSLRIGGATAVYAATGGNKDKTQRLGRWASDAFQGYVWEDRLFTRGLATSMLQAPWDPHRAAY